jgi:GNAT superfamily N-acetyltransferase
MSVMVTDLQQRPEFIGQVRTLDSQAWPVFMYHGEVWSCCWDRLFDAFAAFQIAVVDDSGRVIGVGHTIPITWDGRVEGLPASWDATFQLAVDNYEHGSAPNALAGISVVVPPDAQGQGISVRVLQAMKDIGAREGFASVIVPVRPVLKSKYVLTPMERYARWTRDDGLPFDPWLRTHSKIGGEIIGISNESKVVEGTVMEWEEWTAMRFPESGEYVVPGALDVVQIDRERNTGRYAESNVWLHHRVKSS